MNTNAVRSVLCYGGPRHGEWLDVDTNKRVFECAFRTGMQTGSDHIETIRYFIEHVAYGMHGVRVECEVARCVDDHNERCRPDEIAQFVIGAAIARMAIRPTTRRTEKGELK